jgi:hypothetical protein
MWEICQSGSLSGMWKRSYATVIWAPPDERGGIRQTKPTATARHLDSTVLAHCLPLAIFAQLNWIGNAGLARMIGPFAPIL